MKKLTFLVFSKKTPRMMNLPNTILLQIVGYLDPKGLAKVAQVSTEWKRLVYRPSVWRALRWRQRNHEHFYRSEHLPTYIRHIGEQTDLCFTSWLASKLRHDNEMYMAHMPRKLQLLTNVGDFMSGMKNYWMSRGKPCPHAHHHLWSDVLRTRAYLQSLPSNDITRLHCRLVEYPESETNQYRYWLTEHLQDLSRCDIHSITPLEQPASEDILKILARKAEETTLERRQAYWKIREKNKQKYHDSIRALARVSRHEFETNERFVDKHYSY